MLYINSQSTSEQQTLIYRGVFSTGRAAHPRTTMPQLTDKSGNFTEKVAETKRAGPGFAWTRSLVRGYVFGRVPTWGWTEPATGVPAVPRSVFTATTAAYWFEISQYDSKTTHRATFSKMKIKKNCTELKRRFNFTSLHTQRRWRL